MKRGGSDDAKRAAGESAAEAVSDGMIVGLGTGSTAAHSIRDLGRQVDAGLDIEGIPTSFQSRELAREAGIPLTTLDDARPDVAIDGADQVADGQLVKGGGAAHAREKVVDAAADRLLVVVDPTKEADVLDHPVPVETIPDARQTVADAVRELGGEPELRAAERKDGPVVTPPPRSPSRARWRPIYRRFRACSNTGCSSISPTRFTVGPTRVCGLRLCDLGRNRF